MQSFISKPLDWLMLLRVYIGGLSKYFFCIRSALVVTSLGAQPFKKLLDYVVDPTAWHRQFTRLKLTVNN